MNAWDLVLAHRYSDALAVYDRNLNQAGNDYVEVSNRATALLCLGRLREALGGFERADALMRARPGLYSDGYLIASGITHWLLRERTAAVESFRKAVDGILHRKIKYSDNAGGATPGLLLWYAGCTIRDSSILNYSIEYLTGLSEKPRIRSWPGHLAMYVTGQTGLVDVLKAATGVDDLEHCIVLAADNLAKRRMLAPALFYRAVKSRAEGDEMGCLTWMRACSQLENPILEGEWYLATSEVKTSDSDDTGH